jgi:hypothetical protein
MPPNPLLYYRRRQKYPVTRGISRIRSVTWLSDFSRASVLEVSLSSARLTIAETTSTDIGLVAEVLSTAACSGAQTVLPSEESPLSGCS